MNGMIETKPCYFGSVPSEVALQIFGWLDPKCKVKAEAVCKLFFKWSRQSWSDINGLTVSGAFLTDQMADIDWIHEYGKYCITVKT